LLGNKFGDVDVEKTMQEVTRIFGVLPAGNPGREEEYYINKELVKVCA